MYTYFLQDLHFPQVLLELIVLISPQVQSTTLAPPLLVLLLVLFAITSEGDSRAPAGDQTCKYIHQHDIHSKIERSRHYVLDHSNENQQIRTRPMKPQVPLIRGVLSQW